ncbi:MAG: hypothetical protein LKF42_06700 [Streptococcaceae bacterium]|jgi:hypothetical protein|nr:hypothetical protein [Streptococcaceae bacterium]MCH4178208.1 hypothetical protein [Streptococcaceae bacterium]
MSYGFPDVSGKDWIIRQYNAVFNESISFFEIEQQLYRKLLIKLKILPEIKKKESPSDYVERVKGKLAKHVDEFPKPSKNKNLKQ